MKLWISRLLFLLAALPTVGVGQDQAVYVETRDGTRLAIDLYLPAGTELDSEELRVPALFELTRYWRGGESLDGRRVDSLSGLDRAFLDAGYALVKADVRGTGASFGTRTSEYGRQEVRDGWDLVEWAVNQPWCSGSVGAFGTSYSGTTAEFLAACGHPAVKAVIPGWSDFDMYRSPARPYGLFVEFVATWGRMVAGLDANRDGFVGESVKRVDADEDGELLAAAVREHAENVDVAQAGRRAEFRDDGFGSKDTYAETSSWSWQEEIESSKAAMLVLASWLDAGTAEGALLRFQHFSNPQYVRILASSHGGFAHASPFTVGNRPVQSTPGVAEQVAWRIEFFDHFLKDVDNDVPEWPRLAYFNMGAEELVTSTTWPPAGAAQRRLYFRADGGLSADPPEVADATDRYDVDFGATTGSTNRWWTQMGQPVLRLDDRAAMDERLLTYTTPPLEGDLQIAGTPILTLQVSSSASDGAFFAYLEVVDPAGRSRYLTEGGLRALNRHSGGDARFATGHAHSFERSDAQPLVPGERAELRFQLWPTAALVPAGHRLRVALAGADQGTFERVPNEGAVSWEVSRGAAAPSFLELPVVAEDGELESPR